MSNHVLSPASTVHPGSRGVVERAADFVRTEHGVVTLALAAIGLHVVDDNYLQPAPGTSAGDHLASGLIPVAVLVGGGVGLPPPPRRAARATLGDDARSRSAIGHRRDRRRLLRCSTAGASGDALHRPRSRSPAGLVLLGDRASRRPSGGCVVGGGSRRSLVSPAAALYVGGRRTRCAADTGVRRLPDRLRLRLRRTSRRTGSRPHRARHCRIEDVDCDD